ncbi:hypothetical protein [Nostoc cycadae]|uniref:NADH dehydrogenase subunit 3 n=1 Tax=Nostoc cycadae WK-1 TaxID=1861711 RepID=A0A2H6LJ11_9NOSO|nr:hypothetical protein [Nostoc cycadae]GBE93183.1 NADH dehydrogenase subunit 3 [Nostoc cycadae WK-1]
MRKLPNGVQWNEFHDDEIVDWKRVRSAIEHEDQLTNHRVTWMLTSQGFLFAAFALVFQASTKTDVQYELRAFYQYLLSGLAATGIFVSLYLRLALRAAEIQTEILRGWWVERIGERYKNHPPISGTPPNWLLRMLPFSSFPILFVLSWIIFVLIVLLDFIKPYANTIGTFSLLLTLILGLVIFGFMLGRRKYSKTSV